MPAHAPHPFKRLALSLLGLLSLVILAHCALADEDEQPASKNSITIGVGHYDVNEHAPLFQAHQWTNDGTLGGIQSLRYVQDGLELEGNAIFGPQDFDLKLSVTPNDELFFNVFASNRRKFYDTIGGYYGSENYKLDGELQLDIGSVGFDVGFRPADETEIVFGYEHAYKTGEKALLEWNRPGSKQIYPAVKEVDEESHILTLDVRHSIDGFRIQDNLRYEVYGSDNSRSDLVPASLAGTAEDQGHPVADDSYEFTHLSNVLTAEKWLSDKVFVSAGYLYLNHDGATDFSVAYTSRNGGYSSHAKFYSTDDYGLDETSHKYSLGAFFLPTEHISVSLGVSLENTDTEGNDVINRDHGNPTSEGFHHPVDLEMYLDRRITEENAEIRFTGLPFTTVYARVRAVQEDNTHFEEQREEHDPHELELLRLTDEEFGAETYRFGFTSSPVGMVGVSAYYELVRDDNSYNHIIDEVAAGNEDVGYTAHVEDLNVDSEEVGVKLSLRPAPWLRTSLKYTHENWDVTNRTKATARSEVPGGKSDAGKREADTYTLNVSAQASAALYLSANYYVTNTSTESRDINAPSVVATYIGDAQSVDCSAQYTLDEATSVQCGYRYTTADNKQGNSGSVPAGQSFDWQTLSVGVARQFSDQLQGSLRYEYYEYEDANYDDDRDYAAHGIFVTVTKHF